MKKSIIEEPNFEEPKIEEPETEKTDMKQASIAESVNLSEKETDQNKEEQESNFMILGMCCGLVLGITLGNLFFDSIAIGIPIGTLFGMTVGMGIKRKK